MRPFYFCTIAILTCLTCSKSKCDAFACAILVYSIFYSYINACTRLLMVFHVKQFAKSRSSPALPFVVILSFLAYLARSSLGLSCLPSSWLILLAPPFDLSFLHSPPPLFLAWRIINYIKSALTALSASDGCFLWRMANKFVSRETF